MENLSKSNKKWETIWKKEELLSEFIEFGQLIGDVECIIILQKRLKVPGVFRAFAYAESIHKKEDLSIETLIGLYPETEEIINNYFFKY